MNQIPAQSGTIVFCREPYIVLSAVLLSPKGMTGSVLHIVRFQAPPQPRSIFWAEGSF
jgi:hypothetical protein